MLNLGAIYNNLVLGTTNANGILEVDFFTAKDASGSITVSNGVSNQIINFFSCASNSCEPTTIPTMDEWGLIIFGLLTLNLGVVFLRRKEAILE